MNEIFNHISSGIAGLSGTAMTFAGALAIAGTLAMAILQVIKELTPVRRRYQRKWLERWFNARAERFKVKAADKPHDIIQPYLPLNAKEVQSTLVDLATGGEVNAFYDLNIEQVVAQMNSAAQIALEYPRAYFPLLAILSQGANMEDVAQIVGGAGAKAGGSGSEPAALDARNRVAHRIQRNLDGIQIALGSRWKLWMQAVAITLTVLFVELAIITNVKDYSGVTLLVGIALGIVGGYLAPITRDVVAALQSLRKG